PTRQENMKAWEILLSESQERMLVVVKKGQEDKVQKVFDKWDLNCVQIGEVTDGDRLQYYMNNELVADVPAECLVLGGGAPVYKREFKEPKYFSEAKNFKIDSVPVPSDVKSIAKRLAAHPNIASKRWVYTQYDSMVGTINMSTNNQSDAAIVNLKGTNTALALKVDCNARYVNADPEQGCAIAVSEAARNIVCSGGEPSAITNCLNFGNPYNPEVYWQFVGAIKGMGKACEKFRTPVTGGNVSFYNQSSYEGPVFPTPTIGMLGIVRDKKHITTLGFKSENDSIYLLGHSRNDINSSEYVYSICGVKNSPAPDFDLEEEFLLQQTLMSAIRAGLISSAHDCADGGLFITLLESAMPNGLGFEISSDKSVRKDAFLFGEAQSRVVISVDPKKESDLKALLEKSRLAFSKLGTIKGKNLVIDGENFGGVEGYKVSYDTTLGNLMN
ncbi:MAG TPA: AIR synthase-related protein, partial [Bacteroidia bacterium]|nr:AIR synthase-related protein [Bacteroidia bacterium]